MLVNKTVEFFLSEVVRRGWDWARCRRVPRLGWQRNLQEPGRRRARSDQGLGEMPTTKSPGLAAGSERDACGGQGWAGSGLGATRDRVGGSQINSKESAL